jgi:hypothetical protein
MEDTPTIKITDNERRELEAFTQGYLLGIVADDRAYEGFDEFYSYNDKWDINIHAVGQKARTIYAQCLSADGGRGRISGDRYI